MKRIFMLAALLVAASACATNQPGAGNNSNAGAANTNAATPAATPASVSQADIIAREKEVWEALKRKDHTAFANFLSDDHVGVFEDGVYDKAGTIEGLKNFEPAEVNLSDWKVVPLGGSAAVVVYTAEVKGTAGGRPIPAGMKVRASTAWVNRGGKWQAVFHQDSNYKEAPAGASTGATPATAASPSSSPAAANTTASPGGVLTTANHAERERHLWDALKRKDYDTFASYLAEDQIEVSEAYVNDKAASVSGVRQADLSGATLGDFKEVKINDDAALVIYTVKGPANIFGPEGAHNSTIWVNRGGRWLAAFHHDTPAKSRGR